MNSKIIKKKDNSKHTLSDNIDKVVTNRILALPIFALIMWGVYYIAVSLIQYAPQLFSLSCKKIGYFNIYLSPHHYICQKHPIFLLIF